MRGILLLALWFFGATSVFAGQYTADAFGSIDIGMGVNLLKPGSNSTCVTYGASSTALSDKSQTVYHFMNFVEDYESLRKATGTSVSANFSFSSFSGGGKSEVFNQIGLENYSLFLIVRTVVTYPSRLIKPTDFTPEAKGYLRLNDKAKFREVCGDEYVYSTTKGAEYFAIYQIETQNTLDRQELRRSLTAVVQGFNADGGETVTSSFEKLTKKRKVTAVSFRTGATSVAVSSGAGEIIEEALDFPTQVTPATARSFAVETKSYQSVPTNEVFSTLRYEQNLQVLEELFIDISSQKSREATLRYILENPEQFLKPDLEATQQDMRVVADNLNTLRSARLDCAERANCVRPTQLKPWVYNLPKRVADPAESCGIPIYREKEDPLCGAEKYIAKADASCGVDQWNTGSGPSCGPELYKAVDSELCGVEHYNARPDRVCGVEKVKMKHRQCRLTKAPDAGLDCPDYCEPGWSVTDDGQCERALTCENAAFGVAKYKTCRDPSFGVEKWKTCQSAEFGVSTFKVCENPSFGVASYKSCRRKEFGLEACGIGPNKQVLEGAMWVPVSTLERE